MQTPHFPQGRQNWFANNEFFWQIILQVQIDLYKVQKQVKNEITQKNNTLYYGLMVEDKFKG